MTSAPTLDVPPYQTQSLIPNVVGSAGRAHPSVSVQTLCVQALGSEIYVGCSNGELLRFALQADNPDVGESYSLLSRQVLPHHKPIDEIVLVPCISRALIQSERQVHLYTLPSLDPVPLNVFRPLRNVATFAVDHQHIRRPPQSFSGPPVAPEPVDLCVVTRSGISMYSLREKLVFQKDMPFHPGTTLSRRTGRYLCLADKENYNVVDLETAFLSPILPISQAPSETPIMPLITVISENEFLILSWTGSSTMGVFINGDGDPVRGTLEWSTHPVDQCLDYPHIATLLPDGTIQIHSVETQSIVQTILPPVAPHSSPEHLAERLRLASCLNGYLVPSSQRSDKMRLTSVPLLRRSSQQNVDADDS